MNENGAVILVGYSEFLAFGLAGYGNDVTGCLSLFLVLRESLSWLLSKPELSFDWCPVHFRF